MAIWMQMHRRHLRRIRLVQWTSVGLATCLLACVYIWGRPRSFVACLVCYVAGGLVGRPVARWWLVKPTVTRAACAATMVLLALFACATVTAIAQNLIWR
jgi:hypothetical protein